MPDINSKDATCLANTDRTKSFNEYVQKCRTADDTSRSTNFFSQSKNSLKSTFELLRAEFDDLIISGDSVNSILSLTETTSDGINRRMDTLRKKKESILNEIKHYRRISDSADKSFLEDIMHKSGGPKKEIAPSLQDASLLLFWFAWLIMIVTLTSVRWFSPGGSFLAGLFTLILLLLVTLCLYALLIRIA